MKAINKPVSENNRFRKIRLADPVRKYWREGALRRFPIARGGDIKIVIGGLGMNGLN